MGRLKTLQEKIEKRMRIMNCAAGKHVIDTQTKGKYCKHCDYKPKNNEL